MWFEESVFYQFYPLGVCGAPHENTGARVHADITSLAGWIPHLQKLGVNALYFSPLFESDTHGYDTRDYRKIDQRIGTNEDFAALCRAMHEAGIKVIVDGVFHHVGRGFWAFQDVKANREASIYRDWFYTDFSRDSNYDDGFWYEGWEGHFELVKLNLQNPAVIDYLLDTVRFWVEAFDIDGLRLDVAYLLDHSFLARLRSLGESLKPDFLLAGELLHGDYNQFVSPSLLHTCTNYECYKGLYSSLNSLNLFEIAHSLKRQFGAESWALYRGKALFSFVDNHDVPRIASLLQNPDHLPLIYGLLFGMPGVPCLYYGSEWGMTGEKTDCDWGVRPQVDAPEWNRLTDVIAAMAHARRSSPALQYGAYREVLLTNRQFIFERQTDGQRILIAINADSESYDAHFDAGCGRAVDLLTDTEHDFGGGSTLPACSVFFWECER